MSGQTTDVTSRRKQRGCCRRWPSSRLASFSVPGLAGSQVLSKIALECLPSLWFFLESLERRQTSLLDRSHVAAVVDGRRLGLLRFQCQDLLVPRCCRKSLLSAFRPCVSSWNVWTNDRLHFSTEATWLLSSMAVFSVNFVFSGGTCWLPGVIADRS